MSELFYLIPEIYLLLVTMVVMFARDKEMLGFFSLAVTACLIFFYQPYSEIFLCDNLLHLSKLTKSAKIIFLALGSVVALMFYAYKKIVNTSFDKQDQTITMMLFSILGMMFVVSSNNFIIMYVALELQALPTYIMAASNRKSLASSEAGVKYFIMGSIASCIMVYGLSILYVAFGDLSFERLGAALSMQHGLGIAVAMVFVFIGLLFKVAAAPFHMWVADVYQGSPKQVAAFFAVVPKISLVALLINLFNNNIIHIPYNEVLKINNIFILKELFIAVGMLSIFIGAISALMQKNLIRLIAYSTINHMGYIVLGIALSSGFNSNEYLVISAPMFYIAFYSILNIGLFGIIMLLKDVKIESLSGLSKQNPLLAFIFSILLLSSAGIPPFSGFFAKFYIISEIIRANYIMVALLALIGSAFAVFYYLKIIKTMYFDEPQEDIQLNKSPILITLIFIVSIINVLLFIPLKFLY